jgi:Family of unknown function (DUF6247)
MAAEPLPEYEPYGDDPDDPVEILRVLPVQYHQYFVTEYWETLANARDMEQYRDLRKLLRFWRLRALAYSDPAYEEGLRAVTASLRTGSLEGWASLEDVIASRGDRA